MKSLYKLALESLTHSDENLPDDVYFDVQKMLFVRKNKNVPLHAFIRLLNVTDRRMELYSIFQNQLEIKEALVDSGKKHKIGKLGEFFFETGWYREAESVVKACIDGTSNPFVLFTYYTLLLKIYVADFNFCSADEAFQRALELGDGKNLGVIYSLKGQLLYHNGSLEEAYEICSQAVKKIQEKGPVNIPALVRAVKTQAFIKKEDLPSAVSFIKNEVDKFRDSHEDCVNYAMTYSDILQDYGAVLQRNNQETLAMQAFKLVCKIRENILGIYNLRSILSYMDLSSLDQYVKGNYFSAQARYEQVITIMKTILPDNHEQHLLRLQGTEILILKGMLTTLQSRMEELEL